MDNQNNRPRPMRRGPMRGAAEKPKDFKTAVKTYRSFPVIHLLKQLLELRYGNRKTAFLKSYFSEELPTRELSRGDTIKRLSPLTIFLDTCPPFLIKSSVLANVSLQA